MRKVSFHTRAGARSFLDKYYPSKRARISLPLARVSPSLSLSLALGLGQRLSSLWAGSVGGVCPVSMIYSFALRALVHRCSGPLLSCNGSACRAGASLSFAVQLANPSWVLGFCRCFGWAACWQA